jgi:hypothetical protein
MEENFSPDPAYIKGFNEAYLMGKHEPELLAKLPLDLGNSERSKGFIAGKEQYTLEQKKDRQPVWLKKDRLNNLNDKEIDKDDLDKA